MKKTSGQSPMMSGAPLRVALIGAGNHSRKVYVPGLRRLREAGLAELVAVVELASKQDAARAAIESYGGEVELLLTEPWIDDELPPEFAHELGAAARRLGVQALFVSTEPRSHLKYVKWGHRAGLHVLVDKPLLAVPDSSNDAAMARRVLADYRSLAELCEARPDLLVAVAVQRRHHAGWRAATEKVHEVAQRFACPVTSIQSTHADGRFSLPHEIRDEPYHPTREGYGKLFHSGPHIVDIQCELIGGAARIAGLGYDTFVCSATALRPDGFTHQLPRSTYERVFGREEWARACPASDDELRTAYQGHGELDLGALTTFSSFGTPTLLSQITLEHNSFSRRSWIQARPDLYKGNGRVKHESHRIVQGPFQTILVESYQASDRHEVNGDDEYNLGGNNHFTINVFRNADFWPRGEPVLETIRGSAVATNAGLSADRLLTEHAKTEMIEKFVRCAAGHDPLESHPSRLDSHHLSSAFLSAISESIATARPVKAAVPVSPSCGREAAA